MRRGNVEVELRKLRLIEIYPLFWPKTWIRGSLAEWSGPQNMFAAIRKKVCKVFEQQKTENKENLKTCLYFSRKDWTSNNGFSLTHPPTLLSYSTFTLVTTLVCICYFKMWPRKKEIRETIANI